MIRLGVTLCGAKCMSQRFIPGISLMICKITV